MATHMPERVGGLMEALDNGEPEPLLAKASGTILFEVVDQGRTDQWLVSIDKGSVSVARHDGTSDVTVDCSIRSDPAMTERILRGDANAMTALLRGAVVCAGDPELLYAIQRVFPRPARES